MEGSSLQHANSKIFFFSIQKDAEDAGLFGRTQATGDQFLFFKLSALQIVYKYCVFK